MSNVQYPPAFARLFVLAFGDGEHAMAGKQFIEVFGQQI